MLKKKKRRSEIWPSAPWRADPELLGHSAPLGRKGPKSQPAGRIDPVASTPMRHILLARDATVHSDAWFPNAQQTGRPHRFLQLHLLVQIIRPFFAHI